MSSNQFIVNCSSWAPQHLPKRTTVLHLENNSITSTKDVFNLTASDTLKEVYLGGNHLASLDLPDDNVSRALALLDVSHNNLTRASAEVLGRWMEAAPGLRLRLAGNPWACDCDTRPFFDFLFERFARIKDFSAITCAETGQR
jgi:protein toll